ncbi:ABC transporter permease [Microvirga massiliensis]|uniref:ABC transporter permease n=1 Tax=Microvirga massiliensis TaxID=1033741 RepID=UPI00062B8E9B|nr:ABC transporter permease [Microvirga massiliensis]
MRARLSRGRSLLWALLLPPLLVVLALFVAPLLFLFYVSFMSPSQSELFAHVATLQNYVEVLSDEFYLLIIQRTLLAGAAILAACLLLGYPVAMVVARMSPRWRLMMLMVLLFPLMVSNVVRAYGWLTILGREGVINAALMQLGWIPFPLRMLNTFEAVVLGLLTILLPYMIISIANSLAQIDKSYEEAAQSLGAGPIRTFLHVTWPLSSPGVAAGLALVFFLTLSAYVTITLLGGPRYKLLVSLVYDSVTTLQWPRAAALSFVLLAIALAVGAAIQAALRPQRVQGRGA